MGVWKSGLFVILLQLGRYFCEEAEQCQPGFSSDIHVFKVTRKVLERGRVLGKVSFDDCSEKRLRPYNTEDNRIRINPDGTVSVKRQLTLHAGMKTIAVHTWDSSGNKFATKVLLCNELEHTCTHSPLPDRQTEKVLGLFSRHKRGLRRQKRDWDLTSPIRIIENEKGLYPKKLAQVRLPESYILYSLTGPGADQPPVGTFTIDSSTGWVMVTRPLDREVVDTYKLQCNALSAAGPVGRPLDLTIRVTDLNDNRPVFTQATFHGRVQENSQPGTSVMQVTATDADDSEDSLNGIVTYTILDQEPKLPNGKMFTINRSTGVISVDSMGLEYQKVPQYTLILQATDMDGEGFIATSTAVIEVTVAKAGDPSLCKSMSASPNSPLTTHVLNTASGAPAKDLQLQLCRLDGPTQKWVELTTGSTNSDGRCPGILSPERFTAGTYKLRFETGEFWKQLGQTSFYPYVEVVFTILDPSQKFHIPLLLSPYSYTTYRGS